MNSIFQMFYVLIFTIQSLDTPHIIVRERVLGIALMSVIGVHDSRGVSRVSQTK